MPQKNQKHKQKHFVSQLSYKSNIRIGCIYRSADPRILKTWEPRLDEDEFWNAYLHLLSINHLP